MIYEAGTLSCRGYTPLATASAITSLAPAPRNVLAQLSVVAPVVNTSSNRTRRLALKTASLRTANAPRRFRARASASSLVCVPVSLTRRTFPLRTGTSKARLNPAARCSAWLNSRYRRFRGCNGTGTMPSISRQSIQRCAAPRSQSTRCPPKYISIYYPLSTMGTGALHGLFKIESSPASS